MHPYRVTVLMITCGLVLGGFASPAAAKTIVVTTLDDLADPPFNADGPCGTGTISDLPGADGLVSLREALIAANNTSGTDTVTFDPSLSDGTIIVNFDDLDADTDPDPLPALCGGQTRINGDLDGDSVPDITLEGAAFPAVAPPFAAGISVLSSHNTINGLQVQHFPFGIRILAGDFTNPGTVTHTTVRNNILVESQLDGILMATGDIPDSRLAHTTLTQNLVMNNARFGIVVLANLSAAGSDTHIAHTTITDNEVTGSGVHGIFLFSQGDSNVISDTTLAHNIVSENTFFGITVMGGFAGADGNTLNLRVQDNTVTDNGSVGIHVFAGQENSSNNHVVARIRGNTLERNQGFGIEAAAGSNGFPGASNNNVLDIRLERNTVRDHLGTGIVIVGGAGDTIANGNQAWAIVKHNVIEGNTVRGISLLAGGPGLASENTLDVRVAHNTVCNNGTDIFGEGGFTGSDLNPTPNMGAGNVLTGEIFLNTATTVTVADGMAGNTATVMQFNNVPCP